MFRDRPFEFLWGAGLFLVRPSFLSSARKQGFFQQVESQDILFFGQSESRFFVRFLITI